MNIKDRLLMIRIISMINDERYKKTAKAAGIIDRSHFCGKDDNR